MRPGFDEAAWMRVHMPSHSGELRLVPPPAKYPLLRMSPDCAATSGSPRQYVPGGYVAKFGDVGASQLVVHG